MDEMDEKIAVERNCRVLIKAQVYYVEGLWLKKTWVTEKKH